MAYRRPGVTVTQEFLATAPAIAAFSLPSVTVGPAYQLVTNDSLGSYTGSQTAYAYGDLMAGAIVDLEEMAEDEPFPATKKPVSVNLLSTVVEIVAAQTDGASNGTEFTDATSGAFADVLAGDVLVLAATTGVTIVSAQTNGQSVATSGQRNRLTSPTANQFANVKIGDSVVVTAGTNALTGTYTVVAKPSNTVLVLSADINDGVGPSSDTAYSITGDRGVNANVVVRSKTDDNTLVLQSPLAVEAPLSYSIRRTVGTVELARVASLSSAGFLPSSTNITLPAGLQAVIGSNSYDILSATVSASYRALRVDMAAEVKEYSGPSDIVAAFGSSDQITPANPLAYGLQVMLANTVTSVNGLGLDENAVTNELLSYQAAQDVLGMTEMYAIAPLTQSPVVHTSFKSHVEGFSVPSKKLERVAIVNSKLQTILVLQAESTTVTTASGARPIVNTQVDGAAAFASPATLTDATTNQFADVLPGDKVVIVSGTNVTPGTYNVNAKVDNNTLTLGASFITSGTASDIVYYIYRPDGLGADGVTFYDRNASFISNGVAPGHYIRILSGAQAGRYKIATVNSEKQVTLATQVQGVASHVSSVNYQADRDMSKTEQANSVAGYSAALGSRRVVHAWPDWLKAPIGQSTARVPGYYLGCIVAALTTGLPTQQGLTNLSVSGFLGVEHSSKYFTEEQLDAIADGGTMIFAQDQANLPLYVRHQLTTDRSTIKFQEYSITKNVDFIAKFLRIQYKPYFGQWNIVDTTMDQLKTVGKSAVTFLRDKTRLPKIGGVIRGGVLKKLEEDATQIDTVNLRFEFNIPVPLNNIDIVIAV